MVSSYGEDLCGVSGVVLQSRRLAEVVSFDCALMAGTLNGSRLPKVRHRAMC